MNTATRLAALLAVSSLLATPSLAQVDHSAHGAPASAERSLPDICYDSVMPGMEVAPADNPMADHMSHLEPAHQALMNTMEPMHSDMMTGMMAADIEVAFVCGMIPHHRGAVEMARVQLEYGQDPWLRALAEEIIAAQEQEIADMIAWLEARG